MTAPYGRGSESAHRDHQYLQSRDHRERFPLKIHMRE